MGLDESYYSSYPHEMSGGERQRLVIARALAVSPELLILDEAVASLDVSVQAQVLNLLNNLKKTCNLTYLFISHDLAVVRYMSDRMIVLNKGNIVEIGDADLLCSSPKEEYTRNLLRDSSL